MPSILLEARRLLKDIDCPLDVVVYTPAELDYWKEAPSSFASEVLAEGTTLYERISTKNPSAAVDQPLTATPVSRRSSSA